MQAFLKTRLEKRIALFKLVYDVSFWKKIARTTIKLQSI